MPAIHILIANSRGGVGKSTLAASLSMSLKRLGQRVLLVDADPQGTAASWWQTAQAGGATMAALPYLRTEGNAGVGAAVFQERPNYDFIITDSPSGNVRNDILHSAIGQADRILIPIGESAMDADGIADILQLVSEQPDTPAIHVLHYGIEPGKPQQKVVAIEAAKTHGLPVLESTLARRYFHLSLARNNGQKFIGMAMFSMAVAKLAADADRLALELTNITAGAA